MQPPTNQLNGGTIVQNDTTTYNAGIAQALPWGGGNFLVPVQQQQAGHVEHLRELQPDVHLELQLPRSTQPLLRDFLIDNNRQQLRVTAINRDISEIQLRGTIATTLAAVRNTYWELRLRASRRSRWRADRSTLAERLVEDNRSRVEIGTMAPLDVVQAQAEVATRRQAVAQAEATWRTSELALKRLIVERHRRSALARVDQSDRSADLRARTARRRRRGAQGARAPDGSRAGAPAD